MRVCLPPSSSKVRNAWIFTLTPPTCFHGMVFEHRGVTLSFIILKYICNCNVNIWDKLINANIWNTNFSIMNKSGEEKKSGLMIQGQNNEARNNKNCINSLHKTRLRRSQHKTEKLQTLTQYLTTEPSRQISNVKYAIRKLTQDPTLLVHSLCYCPRRFLRTLATNL